MIYETENQYWIFKAHIDMKQIMDNGNENKSELTETDVDLYKYMSRVKPSARCPTNERTSSGEPGESELLNVKSFA